MIQAAPQRVDEGITGRGCCQRRDACASRCCTREIVHADMKPEYWPYLGRRHEPRCITPLGAGGQVFGHMTLHPRRWAGRPTPPRTRRCLDDLAHRAAQAIENARLYGQAQAAVAARDEFLSIASHELRTPLTALRLALENLRRVAAPRGDRAASRRDRAGAGAGGRRARRRSGWRSSWTALLDVSRIHMGRLELDVEEVELGAVVGEARRRAGATSWPSPARTVASSQATRSRALGPPPRSARW